jgi:lipopolysaccharide biosynthesis glycosyltransferase
MDIACSADAGFLPHVSAMLHSLLTHAGRPVRIHLMHGAELPRDGCAKVGAVAARFGAGLRFLPVPEALLEGFPREQFHVAAWYKILLPLLLPELPRALYLDADMIVADDLAPLWNTDLQGQAFGAVTNPLYPFMRPWPRLDLGLDEPRDYLNSGVLLLDLQRMRDEDSVGALRRYAAAHAHNSCPEQDALSAVLRQRRLHLHPRWNVQNTLFELPPHQLPFSEAQVGEALRQPAIIHFIGPFKPWHYLCRHPRRALYFEHLRGTPWPVLPLQERTWFNRLLRPLPLAAQHRVLQFRQDWRRWRTARSGPSAAAPHGAGG